MVSPWWCRQLGSLWLWSHNNFALPRVWIHICSKYHLSLHFLFSVFIFDSPSLYCFFLNIINSHFISYQSFFFPSLLVERNCNTLYICVFWWCWYIQLIYSLDFVLPPSQFVCPLFHFGMSQNIVLFLKIKIIGLLIFLLYPYFIFKTIWKEN